METEFYTFHYIGYVKDIYEIVIYLAFSFYISKLLQKWKHYKA